jgi:hypothetical protein
VLTDRSGQKVLSSVGWVDHGSVWIFDSDTVTSSSVRVSDAKDQPVASMACLCARGALTAPPVLGGSACRSTSYTTVVRASSLPFQSG